MADPMLRAPKRVANRRRAAASVLLVGALVVLCGCGAAASADAGRSPRPLTAAEADRLDQAQEMLIFRCMASQGLAYTVPPPESRPVVPEFPYGIDDEAWAQAHGYGLADEAKLAAAQQDSPNVRYAARLPPARQVAYDEAVNGTPAHRIAVTVPAGQTVTQSDDGCLAQAQDRLYGDFGQWFRAATITTNLLPAIQPKVFRDARYHRAVAAWSACVGAAGHPAAGPDELRTQASKDGDTVERELAVSDARCNRQVRLAATGFDLDKELGAAIRARFRPETLAYAQMRLAAIRRATSVVPAEGD